MQKKTFLFWTFFTTIILKLDNSETTKMFPLLVLYSEGWNDGRTDPKVEGVLHQLKTRDVTFPSCAKHAVPWVLQSVVCVHKASPHRPFTDRAKKIDRPLWIAHIPVHKVNSLFLDSRKMLTTKLAHCWHGMATMLRSGIVRHFQLLGLVF